MSEEKTKKKRDKNGDSDGCAGFTEMMKNFCTEGKVTGFCAEMKGKCGSTGEGKADFMNMCQQMQDTICNQNEHDGSSKRQHGCCG